MPFWSKPSYSPEWREILQFTGAKSPDDLLHTLAVGITHNVDVIYGAKLKQAGYDVGSPAQKFGQEHETPYRATWMVLVTGHVNGLTATITNAGEMRRLIETDQGLLISRVGEQAIAKWNELTEAERTSLGQSHLARSQPVWPAS